MDQEVETGNGKILPVLQKEEIYPLTPDEITLFAKKAGFSQVSLFSDFELSPFTGKEQSVLAVIQYKNRCQSLKKIGGLHEAPFFNRLTVF